MKMIGFGTATNEASTSAGLPVEKSLKEKPGKPTAIPIPAGKGKEKVKPMHGLPNKFLNTPKEGQHVKLGAKKG